MQQIMTFCMAQAIFFGWTGLGHAARVKMHVDSPATNFTKYGFDFKDYAGKQQADLAMAVSDDHCTWSEKGNRCEERGNPDHCEYGMRKRGAQRSWWIPSFLSTKCFSRSDKDACCLAKRESRPDGVVSAEFVMAAMKVLQDALQLKETTSSFFINRRLLKLVKSIEVLRLMADASEDQRLLGATTRLFFENNLGKQQPSLPRWLDFSRDRTFWTQVAERHNSQFPDQKVEMDVVDSLLAKNKRIQEQLWKKVPLEMTTDKLPIEDISPMAWVSQVIGQTIKKVMDKMNMSTEDRKEIRAKLNDVQGKTSIGAREAKKGMEESTEAAEDALDDIHDALDEAEMHDDADFQEQGSSLIQMDPWTKVALLEGGAAAVVMVGMFLKNIVLLLFHIVTLPFTLAYLAFETVVLYWMFVFL